MRSRRDIQLAAEELISQQESDVVEPELLQLQLEVLLDIRDLLQQYDTRPAVTFPRSPPPPEV